MIRRLPQKVVDWSRDGDALRSRRYGVIETAGGTVVAVYLRPWPKLFSWPELGLAGSERRPNGAADRCWLYYNQPRRFSNFLALKYMASTPGTSYATFLASLRVLDGIAALKGSDALLCDALNRRISDRLLARLGWEPHKPSRWHRNYVKRFYGRYPAHALSLACLAQSDRHVAC